MKKIIAVLIVLVSCFAVFGAVVIFLISRNNSNTTFTLIRGGGVVSYKNNSSENYKNFDNDEGEFPSGTYVKTASEASAEVILPDNSIISLDENTEVQINFQANAIDIQQLAGKTWNRVESVTKGGSYSVKTPTTIAAVRGTIYGVEFNLDSDGGSQTTVYVEESNVEVGDINNSVEKQFIAEGELTDAINSNGHYYLEKAQISDYLRNTGWFKRNIEVDKIYKELRTIKIKQELKDRFKQKLKENKPLLESLREKRAAAPNFGAGFMPDYSNLSDFSTTSCVGFNYVQTDEYIASLDQYSSLMGSEYNNLVNYLKLYSESCANGELDSKEINQLQEMSKVFEQQ